MCEIAGCGKPVRCRGWCRNHYDRWLRHGDPLGGNPPFRQAPPDGLCTIDGCKGKHYARGWCEKHYQRFQKTGDPLKVLPPAGGCPPGHPIHAQRVHPSGPDHPLWVGDEVGYISLHSWVRRMRGNASEFACAYADETCQGPMHWANVSHEYRREVEDFMPLCQSHHFRYDRQSGVWGQTATLRRQG